MGAGWKLLFAAAVVATKYQPAAAGTAVWKNVANVKLIAEHISNSSTLYHQDPGPDARINPVGSDPAHDQKVRGRIMVVHALKDLRRFGLVKQGFFADFNSVVGALHMAERYGAAGVRVYYDTDIYVDKTRGPNYWSYFFQERMVLNETAAVNATEMHFDENTMPHVKRKGRRVRMKLTRFARIVTGGRGQRQPFPAPFPNCTNCGLTVGQCRRLTKRHVRVLPEIKSQVDEFAARHFAGKYIVGVHLRGTDKKLLWPKKSPSPATILNLVEAAVNGRPPGKDFVVFLATDETETVTRMQERFPGRVALLPNAPRMSAKDAVATAKGTHKNKAFDPYTKALTAVLDCLLLARADYIIKNRSSLSDVSLYFSDQTDPRFTYVLADDYVWSFQGDVVKAVGLRESLLYASHPRNVTAGRT